MALLNVNREVQDTFYRYKMPGIIAKVSNSNISRHAYEVSEAGIVIDLFILILIIIIILQEPKSCRACISRTAWSWTLIFLPKVNMGL